MDNNQELMAQLQGLAPEVAAALKPTPFLMPEFTYDVVSKLKVPGVETMNGPVVMVFPNVGADLRIERLERAMGGGNVAHMMATLTVCIKSAPSTWYELPDGVKEPVLALGKLPDDVVLADLYLAFVEWQRSFR